MFSMISPVTGDDEIILLWRQPSPDLAAGTRLMMTVVQMTATCTHPRDLTTT